MLTIGVVRLLIEAAENPFRPILVKLLWPV